MDGRDIFILGSNKSVSTNLDINDALALMNQTKMGKAALKKFINNPNNNLYISYAPTYPSNPLAGYTVVTEKGSLIYNDN